VTPEEVGALWVRALRSGDYEQTTGRLTRVDDDGTMRHCCLGVLCELAVKHGVVKREDETGFGAINYRAVGNEGDRGASYLPLAVQRWAGLSRTNPRSKEPLPEAKRENDGVDTDNGRVSVPTTATLGFLNDELGYTFADIAGVVERDFGIAEEVPE
jgi:hypothetical protein